jgi:hypothetical protein
MTKRAGSKARARHLAGACLLTLAAAVAPAPAQASPTTEAACAHEGILAEKLALARDKGMTMKEAVDAVLAEDRNATRDQAAAVAALLFQRFRYMPADKTAFEFTLACMDDAE